MGSTFGVETKAGGGVGVFSRNTCADRSEWNKPTAATGPTRHWTKSIDLKSLLGCKRETKVFTEQHPENTSSIRIVCWHCCFRMPHFLLRVHASHAEKGGIARKGFGGRDWALERLVVSRVYMHNLSGSDGHVCGESNLTASVWIGILHWFDHFRVPHCML